MKTHLRFLLVLVSMMFVLGGCQNPSGSETPEVNEPPVVETPEDNSNKTKVEFRWCTYYSKYIDNPSIYSINGFETYSPMYLLDLHSDSEGNYVYDLPEGYDVPSYLDLRNDEVLFKEFSNDAFEKVFGTKYYEEGTVIDLKKWTSKAVDLISTNDTLITYAHLYFLAEDVETHIWNPEVLDSFDEIVVGNEDIVVYIYWDRFNIEL